MLCGRRQNVYRQNLASRLGLARAMSRGRRPHGSSACIAVVAAVFSLGLAACGDDEETADEPTETAVAEQTTTEAEPPSPLAEVEGRLDDAGFSVKTDRAV